MAKGPAIRRAGYSYLVVRFDEYEKLTSRKLLHRVSQALQEKDA